MGISVQDTSRLYDKYFRGAKARVMYPAGSGLGLYLVKTIADALGWEVSCISKEGEGTVFEIRFLAEKKEQ
jgi:signal transduction histidine kinase